MKRWYLLSLILALVSGGCAAVQSDSERVVPGGPIVPAERIGPVALGMTVDEVVRILGRPDQIDKNPADHPDQIQRYSFDRIGWFVSFSPIPASEATTISTTSTRYVTDRDIRVGSSGTEVVRAYGREYTTNRGGQTVWAVYSHLGIQFGLWTDNRVFRIAVMRPY